MEKEQFIEEVAKCVKKYAPQYGIQICSPIIAQACLESAYGTSKLSEEAHNYFGLKYKESISELPPYVKTGSEQNPDGSYVSSVMQWCHFSSMEKGIEGYFKFTNTARYINLKGVTSPLQYLTNIKNDGYATSLKYVDNNMAVINKWNLTKYDSAEAVKPAPIQEKSKNSPLINYTKISPNKNSPRNHVIDTITIHCMAGNLSIESCGEIFANTARKASSNYGIGTDGRIALYVDEPDCSWCSSNANNDQRAVTIEVANNGGAETGWSVSDAAMQSLIKLCADICKRNNIKQLKWQGDKTLIGQIDKQNMTVHRWFAAKACPGDYLYNRHGYIADEVNKLLGVKTSEVKTEEPKEEVKEIKNENELPFLVKVTTDALRIRKGPGTNYDIVGCIRTHGIYTIVEVQGSWGKLKSNVGWISLNYTKRV